MSPDELAIANDILSNTIAALTESFNASNVSARDIDVTQTIAQFMA